MQVNFQTGYQNAKYHNLIIIIYLSKPNKKLFKFYKRIPHDNYGDVQAICS